MCVCCRSNLAFRHTVSLSCTEIQGKWWQPKSGIPGETSVQRGTDTHWDSRRLTITGFYELNDLGLSWICPAQVSRIGILSVHDSTADNFSVSEFPSAQRSCLLLQNNDLGLSLICPAQVSRIGILSVRDQTADNFSESEFPSAL